MTLCLLEMMGLLFIVILISKCYTAEIYALPTNQREI